jgi:hypothetical protein
MGRILGFLIIGPAMLAGISAHGEIGTLDVVPAATLLLPYFEADTEAAESPVLDTRFTLRNADPAATLAHVTLYTDYGVPTYAFDVYLTGFDVERLALIDIFAENSLGLAKDSPVTEDPVAGPTDDAIFADGFESGDLSAWTTYESDLTIDSLRAYHTGQPAPREGNCGGRDYGDAVARGYITIDTTQQESTALPSAPGYFVDGGNGIASNANMLTGDYELRNNSHNFAHGNALIHIEASGSGETATPGEYTFYSRFTGLTAADNREPLATNWAMRYLDGGVFDGGTDILYWRDVKTPQGPVNCGAAPSWFPLSVFQLTAFDEEENPANIGQSTALSLACGRLHVNGPELQLPFNFGWIFIDFSGVANGNFGTLNQAAVSTVHSVQGRFAIDYMGLPLNNALDLIP